MSVATELSRSTLAAEADGRRIPWPHKRNLAHSTWIRHAADAADASSAVAGPSTTMTLEERMATIASVGEEINSAERLEELLGRKAKPRCYDGFEPSGRMHIAQGILKAINVNKLTSSGCEFVFWVADWFALLNNKMGGDLKRIRVVGKYMIEVWKACGMDMTNVKFLWCADSINERPDEYWRMVMDIARSFTISRIKRCGQIMGRSEGDDQPASQIFYPAMQAADIFFLGADICQLGMDQRKVNMLAIDYANKIGVPPPVVVSHHMIMGLTGEKMSKSDPNSAIFMEDDTAAIRKKIKAAFCEIGNIEKNPVLEYCKYIIYPAGVVLTIDGEEFATYDAVEAAFLDGSLHPGALKPAVADAIDSLVEPVRQHFRKDPVARELLKKVQSFKVTK
ncbi:tyrosyl-tRNA synthetase [Thecamonas trahens ATCC 50062]|uniref:tyrosine--tRNA ligase n=1 Tax=Thecamonas trahens ATCC 50062 TaxID=461836 RepID=A0A0L0DUG3_THETB|nr:tyrosyl-tRNA synthetase [Thecamonas trahens ATCC 50062]KNC55088.1 tyrosyl-tRNA synthetase [Thecamonas trahens ATCC 50062]|eukprot:XP_013753272.1 tyrosyl-tRNA synthetase [Thecamonas trahens ATCC 50062]